MAAVTFVCIDGLPFVLFILVVHVGGMRGFTHWLLKVLRLCGIWPTMVSPYIGTNVCGPSHAVFFVRETSSLLPSGRSRNFAEDVSPFLPDLCVRTMAMRLCVCSFSASVMATSTPCALSRRFPDGVGHEGRVIREKRAALHTVTLVRWLRSLRIQCVEGTVCLMSRGIARISFCGMRCAKSHGIFLLCRSHRSSQLRRRGGLSRLL